MSNITPIRSPQPQWSGGGGDGHHHHDGWMWNGSQWVWCDPPAPWPCPPPPPPQVQCGPPSCGSAIAKAQSCYDQSQSLYNLVSQVVSDIFAKNPGIIPSPPPSAGSGPIIGVTDGSNALPGNVGEFQQFIGTINFAGYPTTTSLSVSTLILQPGDWDIWTKWQPGTAINGVSYNLVPVPAGMSNDLHGTNFVQSSGPLDPLIDIPVVYSIGRGSFSVPTLLAFGMQIYMDDDSSLVAGVADFNVEARRRR